MSSYGPMVLVMNMRILTRPPHAALQAALVDFAAVDRVAEAGDTTIERLCAIFKEYSDKPCFGIPHKSKPEWKRATYSDVWERIQVGLNFHLRSLMHAVAARSAASVAAEATEGASASQPQPLCKV